VYLCCVQGYKTYSGYKAADVAEDDGDDDAVSEASLRSAIVTAHRLSSLSRRIKYNLRHELKCATSRSCTAVHG